MPCKPDSAARRSPSSNTPTSKVELIPTESIDEPSAARSSRRRYADRSIHELAASLRHEGLLQPICVRRKGTRFELIFGMRRFRAALEAGLTEVPCTVREADDDRALLLNALENLHREQLSNVERVKTIERLAASGLGVREISRRTGFNASTISRWLRINRRPELKKALEDNRLDIARAVILVDAPAPAVSSLIQQAPTISAAELRRRVAAIKTGSQKAIENDRCHLANALRSLRAVRSNVNEPLMVESLQKEIDRISGARGLAALTRIGSEQPRIQRA
jgi:ParB/RepB/Spo0J family partition protein